MTLADTGQPLEAMILTRSLTEYALIVTWLGADPELNVRIWLRNDICSTISQSDEYARHERVRRDRARARGEPDDGGEDTPILTREVRAARMAEARQIEVEIRQLPELEQRVVDPERPLRLPSYLDIATLGESEQIYSLGYRFDSRAAAHPTPLATHQVLERVDGGIRVSPKPVQPLSDPYRMAAMTFAYLLVAASDYLPDEIATGDAQEVLNELQPTA